MGKGGKKVENGSEQTSVKSFTWEEIKTHNKRTDSWIVLDGKVYNVTNFMKKHPGGARVLSSYGGQDATVNWILKFIKLLMNNIKLIKLALQYWNSTEG
jgi:cytochrome b involved in lipid metabolism